MCCGKCSCGAKNNSDGEKTADRTADYPILGDIQDESPELKDGEN